MIKQYFFIFILILGFQVSNAQRHKNRNSFADSIAKLPPSGIASFDATTHNFATIKENNGSVYHDFIFTNVGTSPLNIVNVVTSCGCTSTQWSKETIAPGAKGYVRAAFDPRGRQGPIDKVITVQTDGNPEMVNLNLKGYVTPGKDKVNEIYKYQYGNLGVNSNVLDFPKVNYLAHDSMNIYLLNISNKRIDILKIESPSNIVVKKWVTGMAPKTDMVLYVHFYAVAPAMVGENKQEIKLYTNDDTLPVKTFYVNANVEQDFSKMTEKDKKRAPQLFLDKTELDFGNVQFLRSPSATFTITNKGKDDLVIHRVNKSCSCLSPMLSKNVIKKGESATLTVIYSTANMAGYDEKYLTLVTNDPKQVQQTLKLKINVVP